jgi:hypothetical protein
MIIVLQYPVFEDLNSCSWKASSSGSLFRSFVSLVIVLDGSHVTQTSHWLLAGEPTETSFVIFAYDVQRVQGGLLLESWHFLGVAEAARPEQSIAR